MSHDGVFDFLISKSAPLSSQVIKSSAGRDKCGYVEQKGRAAWRPWRDKQTDTTA